MELQAPSWPGSPLSPILGAGAGPGSTSQIGLSQLVAKGIWAYAPGWLTNHDVGCYDCV